MSGGEGTKFACDELPASAVLPSLVVFDLDNTLWTPELYQLRKLPGYQDASGAGPVADKDVKLFPDARDALLELATAERWRDVSLAAASRTNKGPWAKGLLLQFKINGQPLNELMPFQEIYSSDKTRHFQALREKTGVAYEDMLFFDDSKSGRFGNCDPVAKLGVMSAHCPHGLTRQVWLNALEEFAAAKAAGGGARMGKVLDDPAAAGASGGLRIATIAVWKEDKAFGFVKLDDKSEVFFHRSAVAPGVVLARGARVEVIIGVGRNGKTSCTSVRAVGSSAGVDGAEDSGETIEIDCFSMNQPFAGLVAHGFKTLETRNSTVFQKLTGRWVCLHVGQRTYPDGGMHKEIMRRPGGVKSEPELARLTSLPAGKDSCVGAYNDTHARARAQAHANTHVTLDTPAHLGAGFSKGHVVALLEIGDTELLQEQHLREAPEVELGAVATGAAMGRYLTTVKSATWLTPPGLEMRGFPGVARIRLPTSLIPEEIRSDVVRDVRGAGGGGGGGTSRGGGGGGRGNGPNVATQQAAWARPSR